MLRRTALRRRQAGASLVELMVGLVVGLVVVLGALAMYVGASKTGRDTVLTNRYNQDLRAVMDIMVSDLRRAGYSGGPATNTNIFTAAATDVRIVGADRDCILFAYDTTWRGAAASAGVVDTGLDFSGFRLNNGVVEALRSTGMTSTNQATCDGLGWEPLNDSRVIVVTDLQFDFGGSSCVVAAPQSYNPASASTFTTWTTTSPTAVGACDPAAPGAPSPFPAATNAFSELRRVTITLQGRTNETNAIERDPLVETVVLRNNRVTLP